MFIIYATHKLVNSKLLNTKILDRNTKNFLQAKKKLKYKNCQLSSH